MCQNVIGFFTGVVRIYYDDEHTKLDEEYFQVNGKKEGEYKSYYENGYLCWICTYINDKEEGEYKEYYDTGEISFICYYVDGNENGEYKCYYKNGCELSEDNSKRKNLLKTYSYGQLYKTCFYIDDKDNGEYKEYWANGQLGLIYSCIDGTMYGEYKRFNELGEIIVSFCFDDKKNSKIKE